MGRWLWLWKQCWRSTCAHLGLCLCKQRHVHVVQSRAGRKCVHMSRRCVKKERGGAGEREGEGEGGIPFRVSTLLPILQMTRHWPHTG